MEGQCVPGSPFSIAHGRAEYNGNGRKTLLLAMPPGRAPAGPDRFDRAKWLSSLKF
jgi:hypothetical protein